MADKKISALTAATTPLAGTEVLPIVQSGTTVKVAVSDLTVGRAVSATQLTLSTDNLIIGTANKGIDFSANANAPGMTSELLNDYEEGTWTPSLGGNTTYFSQNGTYTKVGRLVFVQGLLYINVQGTGSTTTISGLPFTPGAGSTAAFTYFSGLTTLVSSLTGRIASGTSSIVIYGLTAAGNAAQTPIATFQNQTYIEFSAVYSV